MKVNTVFLRDSTGISDSMLILFGGAVKCGVQVISWVCTFCERFTFFWCLRPFTSPFQAGHLKMLNGYIEFFMDSSLAECYLQLKEELDKLIENKVSFI